MLQVSSIVLGDRDSNQLTKERRSSSGFPR